jgi:hypothetical protein
MEGFSSPNGASMRVVFFVLRYLLFDSAVEDEYQLRKTLRIFMVLSVNLGAFDPLSVNLRAFDALTLSNFAISY